MDLARVVGTVVCTVKNESLRGTKLLLVQPLRPGGQPVGKPLVALDAVGAGVGETVFYVTGREASFAFLPAVVPADASIVGIVDSVSHADVPATPAPPSKPAATRTTKPKKKPVRQSAKR